MGTKSGRRLLRAISATATGLAIAVAADGCSSYGSENAPVVSGVDAADGPLDAATGGASDTGAGDAGAPDAVATTPRSCEEAKTLLGIQADGLVEIDLDGAGPSPSFVVHCADMATSLPKEYLPLKYTLRNGVVANFSVWGMGGYCNCPPAPRRFFERVRLEIDTLSIDTGDFRFATRDPSTPSACETSSQFCQADGNMRYGQASSCVTNDDKSGSANVDLRGTPFHLAENVIFRVSGAGPAGSGVIDAARKTADIVGGGACGYVATSSDPRDRVKIVLD